jgi:type VI secretion system secreted protein Hcp
MAQNVFIKFEEPGIEGEATASNHANQIEVLSWSHGFNQPTSPTRSSSGGGTVEKANHSDFSFTKYIDSSTDDLLKMCWNGKQIGKATISAGPTATTRRSSISRSPWTR